MSPAANLVLEEVPFAILELVKARILANRRRRQQAKPKPSTRPGAQFRKVGASTKEWRKPQYGAGVFGVSDGIGLAWLYQAPGALNGLETDLFAVESSSRNTSVTFELNVGNNDVFGTGYSIVALPCGGDNMIIIVTSDVRLYPGDTRQFTPDYKALVVSRNAVRMIGIPAAFRSRWISSDVPRIWPPTAEHLYPVLSQYDYFMESVRNYGFSYSLAHGAPVGELTAAYSLHTPGWYSLLNGTLESVSTFQDMSSTIAYKESLLSAAPRPAYELAFCVRNASCPIGRFGIDRYPAQPDTTEIYDPLLWRASGIKSISFDANAASPSGFNTEDRIYMATWDWDQPAYCRQRLLALGFTAADLTP